MKLRIFEARYTRMVKEALRNASPFAICMINQSVDKDHDNYILPLATLVQVIDFEPLNDGFLGITVEGTERCRVTPLRIEKDGLRIGNVEPLGQWQELPCSDKDQSLQQRLKEIYRVYPELGELYPEPELNSATWVCQRWLEILPLEPEVKQQLLDHDSCQSAREYLQQLVQ